MVILAGEEFDRENATLDEDYERAVDRVEFFVDWLWVISRNKVGGNQIPHSSRRCQNFKILGSTPQILHHGIYQYGGECPTIDIGFN